MWLLKSMGVRCIGVGRFEYCGGQGSEYRGGGGGGGGEQGGKLFAGCILIGAPALHQCQIITFLTLKTDDIAKLRIELKSILLELPSNKIKGTDIKLVHV